MMVSAEATRDPNGRPLLFHWRVLRGDPERIKIVPVDETAATVELSIGWHERRPVHGRPELTTDRVDIAVFADNGRELSAPGFISVVFLPTNSVNTRSCRGERGALPASTMPTLSEASFTSTR
jgi:hypothetical protein